MVKIEVKGKIEFYSSDFHAADFVYHRSCNVNFSTGRKSPAQYSLEEKSKGDRPENVIQRNTFLLTCNYFENNDEEQLSLANLIDKMDEFLKDTEYRAYDRRHMKRKLEEFYGKDIVIRGGSGSPTIVTYSKTANSILRDYYQKPRDIDINLQKIQLIEVAAQLIISDINDIMET